MTCNIGTILNNNGTVLYWVSSTIDTLSEADTHNAKYKWVEEYFGLQYEYTYNETSWEKIYRWKMKYQAPHLIYYYFINESDRTLFLLAWG